MDRQLRIPAAGVLIALLALAAGWSARMENGFTLPAYHNADAKFMGAHIMTSVDEGLKVLDLEGNTVRQYDGLYASWLYVQEIPDSGEGAGGAGPKAAKYAVAYSNHANETHILRLTEEEEVVDDRVVLETDTLAIDPVLLRAGKIGKEIGRASCRERV